MGGSFISCALEAGAVHRPLAQSRCVQERMSFLWVWIGVLNLCLRAVRVNNSFRIVCIQLYCISVAICCRTTLVQQVQQLCQPGHRRECTAIAENRPLLIRNPPAPFPPQGYTRTSANKR